MTAPVDVQRSPISAESVDWQANARPSLERRQQIPALTGLRFFAAFFILFAHSCDWIAQFENSDVSRYFSFMAMYGMPLFFVLSGFVIHYNYRELFMRVSFTRAICEFAAARFARLYPLYLCFFLLALAADGFIRNVAHAPQLAAHVVLYYLSLTQTWWYLIYQNKSIIYQLFSVSWSISTEMYFYLCYAVLIFVILTLCRLRRAVLLGVIYSSVVIGFLWALRYHLGTLLLWSEYFLPDYVPLSNFEQSFYRWLFYFSPYVRVLEFFLGCFAAQAYIERSGRPVGPRERFVGSLALWLAGGFLVLAGLLYLAVFDLPVLNAYTQFYALNFLCAPAIAVILFCVSRYDTPFARFMSTPTLVMLGETSYSIYLVHTWTLRIFEQQPQRLTVFWAGEATFRVAWAIAFTLLVSYGTYRLIELPGRAWVRGSLRRGIARVFEQREAGSGRVLATAHRSRSIYTVWAVLALALVAVCGQAARYEYVRSHIRRLVLGDRPEIQVISATYGANCQSFPVPAPYPNLVSSGNATQAVRGVCNGSIQCDFEVTPNRVGDPANGCGKEFAVEYRCLGQTDTHLATISAEALGRHVTLDCSAPNK